MLAADVESRREVDLEDVVGALGPAHVEVLAGEGRLHACATRSARKNGRSLEDRHDDERAVRGGRRSMRARDGLRHARRSSSGVRSGARVSQSDSPGIRTPPGRRDARRAFGPDASSDRAAALEANAAAGLEAEIPSRGEKAQELLALASGHAAAGPGGRRAPRAASSAARRSSSGQPRGAGVGDRDSAPAGETRAGAMRPRELRVEPRRALGEAGRPLGERSLGARLRRGAPRAAANAVARESAGLRWRRRAETRCPAPRGNRRISRARTRQQRPHDAVVSARARARRARQPSAARPRQQVRLERRRPAGARSATRPAPASARHLEERLVADVPGARLRREPEPPAPRGRRGAREEKGSPSRRAWSATNARSRSASRPRQAVVDVADGERPAGRRADLDRAIEQGHRVGAPRHGEENLRARGEQADSSRSRRAPRARDPWLMVREDPGRRSRGGGFCRLLSYSPPDGKRGAWPTELTPPWGRS